MLSLACFPPGIRQGTTTRVNFPTRTQADANHGVDNHSESGIRRLSRKFARPRCKNHWYGINESTCDRTWKRVTRFYGFWVAAGANMALPNDSEILPAFVPFLREARDTFFRKVKRYFNDYQWSKVSQTTIFLSFTENHHRQPEMLKETEIIKWVLLQQSSLENSAKLRM